MSSTAYIKSDESIVLSSSWICFLWFFCAPPLPHLTQTHSIPPLLSWISVTRIPASHKRRQQPSPEGPPPMTHTAGAFEGAVLCGCSVTGSSWYFTVPKQGMGCGWCWPFLGFLEAQKRDDWYDCSKSSKCVIFSFWTIKFAMPIWLD